MPTIKEPLIHYVDQYGVDISKINKIICGRKYSTVLLKNGNIGVCANLLKKVNITIEDLRAPDLNNAEHRILLNAYFNALLNYRNHYDDKTGDIFEIVDFKKYQTIIMIGLFKPLLEKFDQNNIPIRTFDLIKNSSQVLPIEMEMTFIKKADAIILTATSIFNDTFLEIVNNSGEKCDIFILGPSAIMDEDMFRYRNIKYIFGAVFDPADDRVLNAIANGFGTQKFLCFGRKVFF
jgi:uncharacterized protein (DUF4213/DUF364 family)